MPLGPVQVPQHLQNSHRLARQRICRRWRLQSTLAPCHRENPSRTSPNP